MHITNFKQDLAYSRTAVGTITNWIYNNPNVSQVVNVEQDPTYQALDIDLIVYNGAGNAQTVEIKSDRYHTTGNYFFELVSNLERGNIGCLLKCRADLLYYYFDAIHELHIFDTKAIVAWWCANIETFALRKVTTRCGDTLGHYTSLGCLVPRNRVPSNLVTIIKIGAAHD